MPKNAPADQAPPDPDRWPGRAPTPVRSANNEQPAQLSFGLTGANHFTNLRRGRSVKAFKRSATRSRCEHLAARTERHTAFGDHIKAALEKRGILGRRSSAKLRK